VCAREERIVIHSLCVGVAKGEKWAEKIERRPIILYLCESRYSLRITPKLTTMSDSTKDPRDEQDVLSDTPTNTATDDFDAEASPEAHSDFDPKGGGDKLNVHPLTGMYQNWFLDYASYVILERAVPHLYDGLKPVQRRILHTMKRMDDGRYNKVANIAGETMKFHPHGDASIVDALTQMGRQNLLIDCQGSWGNILTGDDAAAPRYIEGRLTKFALDVLFNPKTTEWKLSYDGRNKEPVALPVKFPLLLAQGAEGIAVGLSAKILPHNFGELCDAAIACLRGEEFNLFPDFQTGGLIDVSRYNDGLRGGSVKVRARVEKRDSKTIAITELPYGKTVDTLCESIKKAADKGRIKIRQIQDFTAEQVEILIHLAPGVSSDKTLDALYAFTDCEVSISPNCCIIDTDLQKTILMQRRKDKLIYEGEEEPYNVQDFDVTDVETMQTLVDSASQVEGFVLFDSPGNISEDGLAPLFVGADYIVCPYEYEDKALDSTGVFVQVLNVLREHNPQMTAQLFFVPNRIDPRIGTAEEQEMWRRTDEVFGNFGRVTPVVNSRATLKRTNTFELLGTQRDAVKKAFDYMLRRMK